MGLFNILITTLGWITFIILCIALILIFWAIILYIKNKLKRRSKIVEGDINKTNIDPSIKNQ